MTENHGLTVKDVWNQLTEEQRGIIYNLCLHVASNRIHRGNVEFISTLSDDLQQVIFYLIGLAATGRFKEIQELAREKNDNC